METTMAPSSKKRRCCDTELRLGGGCTDDDAAQALCARWEKKQAATTIGGAHCYAYDGDRLLTVAQHLVVPAGGRDDDDVTGTEVQASAIIRMARAAAGAQDSDRGASRRRRSLGRFLQRRRVVRTHEGAQRRLQSPPPCLHMHQTHTTGTLELSTGVREAFLPTAEPTTSVKVQINNTING